MKTFFKNYWKTYIDSGSFFYHIVAGLLLIAYFIGKLT